MTILASPSMTFPSSSSTIFFDLDNTLFDHQNSLRHAIIAVRQNFTHLQGFTVDELVAKYDEILRWHYDAYLRGEIPHDDVDERKTMAFLNAVDFPEPTSWTRVIFRGIYRKAYRDNRRATPGSRETLRFLRGHGCKLAILTNGRTEEQSAKAEFIGVLQLVDHIIASEQVGYSKPDARIFQRASEIMCTTPARATMVGDSYASDMNGAIDAGVRAILYSPSFRRGTTLANGRQIDVISHMDQLAEALGLTRPVLDGDHDWIRIKALNNPESSGSLVSSGVDLASSSAADGSSP